MVCEMFVHIGQLSLWKFASKIDSKHKTEGPLGKRSLFFCVRINCLILFLRTNHIIGYCKITDCEPFRFGG